MATRTVEVVCHHRPPQGAISASSDYVGRLNEDHRGGCLSWPLGARSADTVPLAEEDGPVGPEDLEQGPEPCGVTWRPDQLDAMTIARLQPSRPGITRVADQDRIESYPAAGGQEPRDGKRLLDHGGDRGLRLRAAGKHHRDQYREHQPPGTGREGPDAAGVERRPIARV